MLMTLVGWSRRTGPLLLLAMLAACATAGPRPLPTAPSTLASTAGLKVDPAKLRLAPLKRIVVDPRDGLDPDEIAVLAVLNSPQLRARRAAAKVSQAQVFSAGLLPDPQITAGADFPATPGATLAYAVSAAIDIQALIARSAALAAAKGTARQADLDLLWAEWQAAQQARQLAWTALTDEARAKLLRSVRDQARDRYEKSRAAMARGDVSGPAAASDLAVEMDAQAQLTTAEHDAAKARLDLNAMLNLEPQVRAPLVFGPAPSTYGPDAIAAAARQVADRRPDLLALQAGYAAQNAKLRQAILTQFPLLNVAGNHARDNSAIASNGVAGTFALPIFNGNRGQVAIEKATREQLHAEYQARLDQTQAEIAAAQAEIASLRGALGELEVSVPRLEALARQARAAYDRGDIDSATYLTLVQNALTRRADLEDKRLQALQAEAALEQALFLPPAELRAS
jgi:outer membrane protein TolC